MAVPIILLSYYPIIHHPYYRVGLQGFAGDFGSKWLCFVVGATGRRSQAEVDVAYGDGRGSWVEGPERVSLAACGPWSVGAEAVLPGLRPFGAVNLRPSAGWWPSGATKLVEVMARRKMVSAKASLSSGSR